MYPFVRPNPLQQVYDAIAGGQEIPLGGSGGYGGTAPALSATSRPVGRLAELEQILSRPQPYQKQEEQPEATKSRKVLAAIKDAIAGYVEGRTGRPVSYAGAQDRIRATKERNAQIREQNRLGEERARAEGERSSALLEYQRLQQEKEQGIRAQELADARAEKLRQDKVESSRFIAEEEGKNVRQKNQIAADKELAELRGELKVKEIQAKPVKPPAAAKTPTDVAKQRKKAEEVMKFLAEAKSGIAQQIAGGLATDDVRRRLQAEMDARNLDGEDRQMVINFFAKHIQPILKKQDDLVKAGRVGG